MKRKPNVSKHNATRRKQAARPRAQARPKAGSLRKSAPVLLLIAVAASLFGVQVADRGPLSATREAEDPTQAVVKRALPDGVSEEGVPKWVPMRQASGRTELEPWTSVDAELANESHGLSDALAPQERTRAADRDADWLSADSVDELEEESAEASSEALGVEAGSNAPGDAEEVLEHVEGSGS